MKRQSSSYGQAGGRGQGQPYSRFQIESDPTPYVPIWAAGSMVSTVPAHLMGNEGGAYYYDAQIKVGGITNMVSNGEVLRSMICTQGVPVNPGPLQLLLGGTSVGNYDAIQTANQVQVRTFPVLFFDARALPVVVNGEFCHRDTTLALYGADSFTESFTVAGTITATPGSKNIVGAGTAFTTAALPGYAYTPSLNAPRVGDLLEVIDAGNSRFYRIQVITDATHMMIFPAYVGAGGPGLTYKIRRSGYGSWSRIEKISNGNSWNLYYAGNALHASSTALAGTVECASITDAKHYMAPQNTGATNVQAADVAFYKGFLLYGYQNAVGWSVAGFPTSFATGFGATDFPAQNISAFAGNDTFCCFEYLGDQLVAMFLDSMWLVQATGIVPEFTFYRLAEPQGVLLTGVPDPQTPDSTINNQTFTRPSASLRGEIAYAGVGGLMQFSGSTSDHVSQPVETHELLNSPMVVTWDPSSNSVAFYNSLGNNGGRAAVILDVERKSWSQMDLSALSAKGITGGVFTGLLTGRPYRSYSYGFWSNKATYLASQSLDIETSLTSVVPWTYASPILVLGSVYSGFTVGGFQIWARGSPGAPQDGTVTLNWTIYGGTDPYHMSIRQGPTAYDYATGFGSARYLLGNLIDDPYVGFVLTGSKWIELAGIVVYPGDNKGA
jgi:hypothetical protein